MESGPPSATQPNAAAASGAPGAAADPPGDASAAGPPAAGTAAAEPPAASSERMSLKDKVTLAIAILSLAISGATFLLNRTEAHRSSVAAENRAAYAAYELGKRLALSFVVYHQVDQGTPAAIAAARQEALYKAREAQPYANGLGVEFSIAELIAQYRPGQSVFNESVIDAVAIRLRASHPEPVVEKFRLGFAFFWLMFNIGAAEQANRDFLPRLAEGYPAIAADINRQLGDMGVQERLPPTLADPAAVFQLAPRIRREMEAVLDAARRS